MLALLIILDIHCFNMQHCKFSFTIFYGYSFWTWKTAEFIPLVPFFLHVFAPFLKSRDNRQRFSWDIKCCTFFRSGHNLTSKLAFWMASLSLVSSLLFRNLHTVFFCYITLISWVRMFSILNNFLARSEA